MKRRERFDPRVAWIAGMGLLSLGGALLSGCGGSDTSGGGGSTSSTTTSTGGAGGGSMCNPPPQEVPSKQKVSVEITNTAAAPRYVITACNNCETLRVEVMGDLDYVPVPVFLTPAETCGCECPEPAVYPLGYHRIQPGEKYSASWDARTIEPCTYDEDCGGGQTAKVTVGALWPADPGDYRVSFGVIENLPAECTQTGATEEFSCSPPAQQGLDPGGGWYPVEVTLPATGDVSATLSIP